MSGPSNQNVTTNGIQPEIQNQPKIKKTFQSLVDLLEANKTRAVSTILEQVYELASAKNKGTGEPREIPYLLDATQKPIAILCWYYKKWMPLVGDKAVKFGIKVSTKTGYNTMSLDGSNLWSKQNLAFKKAGLNLLDRLTNGDIKISSIPEERKKIAEAKSKIEKTEHGFDTKEQLLAYLKQNKIEIAG